MYFKFQKLTFKISTTFADCTIHNDMEIRNLNDSYIRYFSEFFRPAEPENH